MINKEIIIDDVDVSECKYFCKYNSICKSDNMSKFIRPMCKDVKNCYYKQLQRKIEECELMEIAIKIKDQRNEDYSKALADKSKKCEELKEENEELVQRNTFLLQRLEVDDTDTSLVFKLQNELRQKDNGFYQAIKSNVKYKQALDEIKEECNQVLVDINMQSMAKVCFTHRILNIINKANDGEQ